MLIPASVGMRVLPIYDIRSFPGFGLGHRPGLFFERLRDVFSLILR